MGSYRRFESGFFAALYEPSPHGMNFTIGFLSREYNIPGGEIRDLLKEWWQKKLLSLKNSGITFEEWGQKHPNDDFFCWPQGNPQFLVELTSRGEDFAASLQQRQDGETTSLQPTVKATAELIPAGVEGRFRIVRELGAGGMGAVFLAEQVQVGNRLVALKVLLRKLLDDPEFLLRFQNEAASTGKIHHPNVVTVYESGQTDDGTPYIAMEYLEGETLRKSIQRRGAIPVTECAEIVNQVARGLGAAHRLGIIHRDLKPDNIFLTRSEEGELAVKVLDFGIAKLRESAAHTVTGMVLGTPQYMSYEQASGMRSENLDSRSDLYSLGIITYEMLTGSLPFDSDTPLGYLRSHLTEEPPPIRTVNPDLAACGQIENVVMKALAKNRDQRYGSVMEFAHEIAQAAQAIVTGSGADLPTTVRVVPLSPASSPEPAFPGWLGRGAMEPDFQSLPPLLEEVQPPLVTPHTRQQVPPVGGLQVTNTPPPHSTMVASKWGKAKYWIVGLAAVAVIAAVAIWYPYRTSPERSIQSRVPTGTTVPPAGLAPGKSGDIEQQERPSMQRGGTALAPALTTATASSAAHVDAGIKLEGNHDWDGAIAEYREALHIDPKNANAHYNLGSALEQTGSFHEALQEYREAHNLSPENPVFQTAYERLLQQAKSQSEPATPAVAQTPRRKFDSAARVLGDQEPSPASSQSRITQGLVNGSFVVQPLRYGMVQFSVPEGATQATVNGFFRASGGTGNDIQIVIANPAEFQDFISGKQAQVFYVTGKSTAGAINIKNLPPGSYILAFNNKFSALSRKQVTAVVTLSYIP